MRGSGKRKEGLVGHVACRAEPQRNWGVLDCYEKESKNSRVRRSREVNEDWQARAKRFSSYA